MSGRADRSRSALRLRIENELQLDLAVGALKMLRDDTGSNESAAGA